MTQDEINNGVKLARAALLYSLLVRRKYSEKTREAIITLFGDEVDAAIELDLAGIYREPVDQRSTEEE